MRQLKNTKRALTYIELSIRAFIFSILLMGNVLILISTATSNPIFAQGIVRNASRQHLVAQKPLAVVSTQNREQSKGQIASRIQKELAGHLSTSSHSTGKTSAIVAAPSIPPLDLSIAATVEGGPTFQVGQTLTFDVNVTNISSTTTLNSTSGVAGFGVIPLGLSNIVAIGSGWNVNTSASISPATVAANYTGVPVGPGAAFAPIVVTGILNSNAVPVFASTLGASDNTNPNTALTTFSVNVSSSTQNPTATAIATATATATATVTPVTNSELGISVNIHGGPTFQVGQTLTFDVNVTNISSTTTLDSTSGVKTGGVVPSGLSNIVTTGSNWTVTSTASNGPFLIKVVYNGPPVAPGGAFPPFEISGTLNSSASPVYIGSAAALDNSDPTLALANFNLNVSPAPPVTATPITNSELGISSNVHGGPTFQVGQTLTYDLNITNISSTTTLDSTSGVAVGSVIPLGLSNIVTTGSDWTIIATAANGPFLIKAGYSGPPVAPGGTFPPFEISGTLNPNASPVYMSGGAALDTHDPTYAVTTFSLNVSPAPTVTATPVPTPTVTATTTVTTTVTATPVPTPTVTATTTVTTTVTATPVPTPTVTATATVTTTPVPTPTITPTPAVIKPQLYVVDSNTGGNVYHVGQTVNYNLVVANLPSSLAENQPITVYDVLPVGLNNIVASASSDWTISMSSTTSPTMITAQYHGLYPVTPGTLLPSISISGDLTEAAVPSFTSNATVHSADDPNPSLNTSINTIFILESVPTSTPIPTTTPMSGARLAIVNTTTNGDNFEVGEKVNYVVVVSSDPSGGPITAPGGFSVSYVMPLGMSEIEAKGDHWRFSISDHTSPMLITAQYTGSYPIEPDSSLPAITITGKLNKNAVPSFTTTAIVDDSPLNGTSEEGTDNNDIATYTVFVKNASNNHHQNGNGNNDPNNQNGNGNNDPNNQNGNGNNDPNNQNGNGNNDPNNQNGNNDGSSPSESGSRDSSSGATGNSDRNSSGSSITPSLPATGGSPLVNEF